ncbi:cation-translocating P-type ATPase [Diplocloster hominis]|uniref:cation-translocating P-type ATPase n=1 Tax=Diplocloster hominis TaxID=3079010 RepID=UPI0031BBBCA8
MNTQLEKGIDIRGGLTSEEVEQRLNDGRFNYQEDANAKSIKQIIRDNLLTFFNLINAVLAGLIIFVGSFKNLFFLGIVICNTAIGIFQEIRAKKTLDKLSLITASKVTVRRNHKSEKISIDDVVLDDIMLLTTGNQICADSVVRQGTLEVNESLISGESDIIVKRPGDHLFSGSFVVSGQAAVQVEHVGEDNFAFKIMSEARKLKKHSSELQRSINIILKIISILIVPLGAGLFASQYFISKATFADSIVNMVAAVLGMIPEGLVLLTSIALAVGVIHLGKRQVLVHELFCIETLARVDVLCLDKTGTLTEGTMKVEDLILLEENVPAEEIIGNIMYSLQDDNATFMAMKEHFPEYQNYRAVHTIPFSSARKYSGVSFEGKGTYIMGAYEFMFPQEDSFLRQKIDMHTSKGIRVLVLAHSPAMTDGTGLPEGLKACAIILLSDVIRSDAKDTLRYFAERDVRLMVISGDNPATVANIARKAGLTGADAYVDATKLKTKKEIQEAVEKYQVFGRVTPEQKKEIVLALKKAKHTVAMTGDGVNDVLALKEADCSIAMAAGSDAAKNCSNLVLLDSNFGSMPYIVREGRRVINNIQSAASLFLVKTIFSLILTIMSLLISASYPFIPIQLSIISMWAVGIPTFVLSLEPNFNRVSGSFLKNVLQNALTGALTIVLEIICITAFCRLFDTPVSVRSTMCVLTTGITSLYMIRKVYPLESVIRKVIYYVMFFLFLVSLLLVPDMLNMVDIKFREIIVVLGLVLFTPHLIDTIYEILNYGKRLYRKITAYFRNRKRQNSAAPKVLP